MARAAKTTGKARSGKGGRPAASPRSAASVRGKVVRKTATAPRRQAAASAPAVARMSPGKVSKDELRDQVEKLTRSVATLRTKSRELVRAGKEREAHVAELETEIARLGRGAPKPASAKAAAKAPAAKAPSTRAVAPKPPSVKPASDKIKRGGPARGGKRARDPGDAVPPGVAVDEPEALDEDAEAVQGKLEQMSED